MNSWMVVPPTAWRPPPITFPSGRGTDKRDRPPRYRNSGLPDAAAAASGKPLFRYLGGRSRSEEHTSELQSQSNLVCRLLLEKKKKTQKKTTQQIEESSN